jgi:hypothetical protein
VHTSTESAGSRRILVTNALRQLIASAHALGAPLPVASLEREFYRGIEAAAQDVLQPERARAKPACWLEREAPAFLEGYARTSALVATAMMLDPFPLALTLPAFELA